MLEHPSPADVSRSGRRDQHYICRRPCVPADEGPDALVVVFHVFSTTLELMVISVRTEAGPQGLEVVKTADNDRDRHIQYVTAQRKLLIFINDGFHALIPQNKILYPAKRRDFIDYITQAASDILQP